MYKNVQYIANLDKVFSRYPARKKVALCMIEHGFRINEQGKILSGDIEISPVKLARFLKIDRRVVGDTVEFILSSNLKKLFTKIKPMARLDDVSKELGLGVIRIHVKNAKKTGIVYKTTEILAKFNVPIYQLIAEAVELEQEPTLTIVLDSDIPANVINQLRNLEFVKKVELI